MGALKLMNCGVEELCVIICVVLFIQAQTTKNKRDTDRWFKIAIVGNIGLLLGDILNWALGGTDVPGAYGLITAGNVLFFLFCEVFMYGIFTYVYTYMQHKTAMPKGTMYAVRVMLALEAVFILTTPFTHLAFYVTEANDYVRGSVWIVTQLPPLVMFFAVLKLYACGWSELDRKERVWFSMYLGFMVVGEVVQVFVTEVAINSVMFTLVMLLISMFIHKELDEQLHTSEQRLEQERVRALSELQQRQSEITNEIIIALSNSAEAKSRSISGHSRRVAEYSGEIARRMGLPEEDVKIIYHAGMLHDVGKIRVSETILNKEGELTEEEYTRLKLHTMAGYYILKEISSTGEFAVGARWHHERYDGSGYPNGLSGENIPLVARIITVADYYDRLTSDNGARKARTQEEARAEMLKASGSRLDPSIAAVMLRMIDEDTGFRMRQPNADVERVILAIDDDPMVHKLLEMMFRSQPYTLKFANGGAQGLEMLKKEPVDMVLLDMEMPEVNGFDVLEWIRGNRENIPVVVMTGDRDIDIIQRTERLGVSDYLTKPLVGHMLLESVQNVLQSSGSIN